RGARQTRSAASFAAGTRALLVACSLDVSRVQNRALAPRRASRCRSRIHLATAVTPADDVALAIGYDPVARRPYLDLTAIGRVMHVGPTVAFHTPILGCAYPRLTVPEGESIIGRLGQ